jgi:glutathione synthase/RimK-type ligase-like ATP-grasp enzyme
MRFKLFPYKPGSSSAKKLARGLGILRVRSSYDPKRRDVIINWGNSTPERWIRAEHDLNKPEAIARACNKLKAFQTLWKNGFEHIPEWTTDGGLAYNWVVEQGSKVYCRTTLTGHSGRGIIVASSAEQIVDAPLYTKATRHKNEYRVHVFKDKVIDVQQKKRRIGVDANTLVRNHSNGWVFARADIEPPEQLLSSAVRAVQLLGLDFGAVDIGHRVIDNKVFVFEVNTAPGIEGTTLQRYVNTFNEYIYGV